MSRREEFLRRLGRNPYAPYQEPPPSEELKMLPQSYQVQNTLRQYFPSADPAHNLLNDPTRTTSFIPDTAAAARGQFQSGRLAFGAGGFYGADRNLITVDPEHIRSDMEGQGNVTLAHEAGHAIWTKSSTPQEQDDWGQIHVAATQPHIDKWFGPGMSLNVAVGQTIPGTYGYAYPVERDMGMHPNDPFIRYWNDPAHSFAEAYGNYVANPEWLKKNYPAAYDFLEKKLGFEYSRKIGPGSLKK